MEVLSWGDGLGRVWAGWELGAWGDVNASMFDALQLMLIALGECPSGSDSARSGSPPLPLVPTGPLFDL